MTFKDRQAKIMNGLNLNGLGLEIGPSYGAIAPRRDGFDTRILDHLSREDLIYKYNLVGTEIEKNVEEVDYVWSGQSYRDLVGVARFDWVIASHVIEHVPDIIGFLNECSSIMKDDGVLSLVVPDKRFCFDVYRPLTGLARAIDAHVLKSKAPTPGAVAEHCMSAATKSGSLMWTPNQPESPALIHDVAYAKMCYDDVVNRGKYIDVHCWTFTPESFELILSDFYQLGLVDLKQVSPPEGGGEFFVQLSRSGSGTHRSRQELLLATHASAQIS